MGLEAEVLWMNTTKTIYGTKHFSRGVRKACLLLIWMISLFNKHYRTTELIGCLQTDITPLRARQKDVHMIKHAGSLRGTYRITATTDPLFAFKT